MKKILLPILFLLFVLSVQAQPASNAARYVQRGLDASKGASCSPGKIWLATDTGILYLCPVSTWVSFGTGGAAGANTALSNLASVSINTSLLAQTGVDAGSTTKPFRDLFLFGSGTYATTYLRLTGTPTSTRVWTIQNATDTFVGLATSDTLLNKTLTSPVIANIAPAADFTITQNSVTPFKSVNSGAIVNTLVANAGKVGIGIASPTDPLTINGNTGTPPTTIGGTLVRLVGADGSTGGTLVDTFGNLPIYIFRRASGTEASPTQTIISDNLGQIAWRGYTSSAAYTNTRASFSAFASESFTSTAQGTYLSFLTTANTTTTTTEKVRIDNAGNLNLVSGQVGFGVAAAPTAGLAQNTTAILAVTNGSGTTGTGSLLVNNLSTAAKVINYNSVATAGWGVPAIYGSGRATAQVAANASVATYTVGAADGSFEISANVLVTTATTHAFTVTCTYTDEGNTSRTITLTFSQLSGTLLTSIANTGGAVPYEGVPLHIRCKASTSITIATTGTFTSVVYNVEGIIKQTS